jgi:hypothetical protein
VPSVLPPDAVRSYRTISPLPFDSLRWLNTGLS